MTLMTAHTNGTKPITHVPCAVLYTRVSTDGQAEEGTSLESQRTACLEKARRYPGQVASRTRGSAIAVTK